MKVTICPPGAARGSDGVCQFDKRKHIITKDNGIAFDDMNRMSVHRRSTHGGKHNPIPRWATDDVLLRKVVIAYLENTVYLGCRRPKLRTDLPDAERLKDVRDRSKEMIFPLRCNLVGMLNRYNKMVEAGEPEVSLDKFAGQIQTVDSRIKCIERGLDVLATSVSYLCYRLNYNSVQVAQELKLKPSHVRQILNRLNHFWTVISGEQVVSSYSPGGKWFRRPTKIWPVWKRQLLFVLRASGRSYTECAKILKIGGKGHGASAAREAYVRYFDPVGGPVGEPKPGTTMVKMERLPDGGKRIAYRVLDSNPRG